MFGVCILITIPAQQVYKWVSLPVEISIGGITGHISEGNASQVVIKGVAIQNLKWVWKPSALLVGRLAFDWTISGQQIQGNGQLLLSLMGPIQIRATDLEMDSRLFNSQLPEGISSDGKLYLHIVEAEFEKKIYRLTANLTGRSVTIGTAAGSYYQAKIDSSINGKINEQYIIHIADGENEEDYNLLFEIEADGRISGSGVIKKETDLAFQLSSFLPLIATQQEHQWKMNWNSQIPPTFSYLVRDVP